MPEIFRLGSYHRPVKRNQAVQQKKKESPKSIPDPILFRPWLVSLAYKQKLPHIKDNRVQKLVADKPELSKRLVKDIWQRFYELAELVPTAITCHSIRVNIDDLTSGEHNAVELIIGKHYQIVGEVLESKIGSVYKPYQCWVSKEMVVYQALQCIREAGLASVLPKHIDNLVVSESCVEEKSSLVLINLYLQDQWRWFAIFSLPLLLAFILTNFVVPLVSLQILIYGALLLRFSALKLIRKHIIQKSGLLDSRFSFSLLGLSKLIFKLGCLCLTDAQTGGDDILKLQEALDKHANEKYFSSLPTDAEQELDRLLSLDENNNLPTLSEKDIAFLLKMSAQASDYYEILAYRARAGQEIMARIKKSHLDDLIECFHIHDIFVSISALKMQVYLSEGSSLNILAMRSLTLEHLDEVLLKVTIQVAMLRPKLAILFPVPGKRNYNKDTQVLRKQAIEQLGPMIYNAIFWPVDSEYVEKIINRKFMRQSHILKLASRNNVANLLDAYIDIVDMPMSLSKIRNWVEKNQWLMTDVAAFNRLKSLSIKDSTTQVELEKERALVTKCLKQMILSGRLPTLIDDHCLMVLLSNRQWLELFTCLAHQNAKQAFVISDQLVSVILHLLNHVSEAAAHDRNWSAVINVFCAYLKQRESIATPGPLYGLKHQWPHSSINELDGIIETHNTRLVAKWYDHFRIKSKPSIRLSHYQAKPKSSSATIAR